MLFKLQREARVHIWDNELQIEYFRNGVIGAEKRLFIGWLSVKKGSLEKG